MKPETIQEKFGNSLYHSAIFIPEWHLIKESLVVDKDNTNCFLITLKSGGTGLNLTSGWYRNSFRRLVESTSWKSSNR